MKEKFQKEEKGRKMVSRYEGKFLDFLRNGIGTYTYNDKAVYIGEFKDN